MQGGIYPGMGNIPTGLAFLLLSSVVHATDLDQDDAQRLREVGAIRPLAVILEAAQAARPGRPLEVELKRERGRLLYEIVILDPKGRVWELRIDAASATLLSTTREK